MADDLILKAGLDGSDVEATIVRMEKRVKKMADSADKDMKRMGKSLVGGLQAVRSQWEAINKETKKQSNLKYGPGKDITKQFKDLKKVIKSLSKPLDAMVKQVQQVQTILAKDLDTGELKLMPRFEVRDEIERGFAEIKGDVLLQNLATIFMRAEGLVKNAAFNMTQDLVAAFEDSTMSGHQLLTLVAQVEARMKAISAAAVDAQILDVGGEIISRGRGKDITAGVISEEKGEAMVGRIDKLMDRTSGRIKDQAAVIKADLANLLDQGFEGMGGAEFTKQINSIISRYNALSGLRPVDLITGEEINDAVKLENAYDVAGATYKRIMSEGTAEAKERAKELYENIQAEKASATAGQQSKAAANQAVRQYLSTLKELGQFKADDPLQKMLAKMDANALRDRMFKYMSGGNDVIKQFATEYKDRLTGMLNDPDISAKQMFTTLNQIEKEMDDVINKARETQQVQIGPQPGGVSGMGGQRGMLAEDLGMKEARVRAEELEQRVTSVLGKISGEASETAAKVKLQLETMFDVEPAGGAKAIQSELNGLEQTIKRLEGLRPAGALEAEQESQVQAVNSAYEDLEKTWNELISIAGVAGTQDALKHKVAADVAKQRANDDKANASRRLGEIRKLDGELKKEINRVKEAEKAWDAVNTQIIASTQHVTTMGAAAQKVNVADAYRRLNTVLRQSGALMKSGKKDARDVGHALRNAAEQAQAAFKRGDITLEEFNEELTKVEGLARKAGTAFKENIDRGARGARVSIWKVGNALDRTGVRGAGGIIRIVDAFRGLGPVAIGAAIAIGGILIAVSKLATAVVELGKKAAQAFTQFIKGAVETSKKIQVTDRHLGALIKRPELGGAFRDYLLDQSFRVGIDLTEDFSRVVVPLAQTTEEIERAAEAAGVLAHAFGETSESISRAFKQAAGGHFRPFQQLFGITPQEIDQIQEYQKTMGELPGVIKGIEEALETRGLSLGAFEGTLSLITGRLDVLKRQVEITVGTPVRDALAEQLQNIFNIVEERGPALNQFFTKVGEVVAGVIERAGEFVQALIGEVDDQDLVDLGTAFEGLGQKVSDAVEAITELLTTEDRNIVETIEFLIDKLTDLTDKLVTVINFFEDLQRAGNFPEPDSPYYETEEFLAKPKSQQAAEQRFGYAAQVLPGGPGYKQTQEAARDAWNIVWGSMLGSLEDGSGEFEISQDDIEKYKEASARLLDTPQPLVREITKPGFWKETAEEIDKTTIATDAFNEAQARTEARTERTMHSLEDFAKALETLNKAEAKMALDRQHREAELITKFERAKIDDQLKASQDREDLYADHMNDLRELEFDLASDQEKVRQQHQDKDASAYIKYQDKLADIDRKNAEKKIDIEEKFREKLEDIRRRFDLDAEEAIRRNDAVALLRIRRKMRAELQEAEIQRQRSVEDADESRDKEREDAKIAYDRALRDNQTFEDNKLRDLEIANDEKRAEMRRQLTWEKKTLAIEMKRQRAARKEERERAFTDLETDFQNRREAHELQYSDEYNIVEYWKSKESTLLEDTLGEQDSLLRTTYNTWLSYMAPMRQLIDTIYGFGNMSLAGFNVGPYASGYGNYLDMQDLEGYDPSNPPIWMGGIRGRFLIPPYQDPINGGGEQRQHGGFVTPGNVYGVNERGVEAFMSTQAGIVLPREAMMLSPQSGTHIGNIDNSKHLSADVDLIDPNQMSPILRTMARSILTDEILNIGF